MKLFRLCKAGFATDLSGKGAEVAGGRWNSKGTPLVYTSSSRALCLLEVAVHLPLYLVPADFRLITLEIPDELKMQEVPVNRLPLNWKQYPYPVSCQHIGDLFVKNEKLPVLKVPSAIVQDEWNYLLNPRHTDIRKIKIVRNDPFAFDERLMGKK